ncbi:PadR family transcriptional regulator [Martelella sp. HB161492]|uniref:PadR family transcriptional regulator n=1 Tax=Martelella sp. HB161492 TaxID=2720726 RepID=UPI001FEDF9BE|nr:PadR family transcriptional regulator [Martelella sp. HB161492]
MRGMYDEEEMARFGEKLRGRGERMRAMFAAGFEGRGHGRHGRHGGPDGFGDDDGEGFGRGGRFLRQGNIRILVLKLIADEPRHGYEIIKAIEDMSGGAYAPSPGVIYPTLSFLEEGGFVLAEAEGNKKRYRITEEGRAHLDENEAIAKMAIKALELIAARTASRDERHGRSGGRDGLPRSVDAALLNLREVIARRLALDPANASEIVRELLKVADSLE